MKFAWAAQVVNVRIPSITEMASSRWVTVPNLVSRLTARAIENSG
jgi:hypothetical protein